MTVDAKEDVISGGPRNELIGPDFTQVQDARQRPQYYAWEVYFPNHDPTLGDLPNPPPYLSPPSAFNLFFQFHQDGNCFGPPVSLGLNRTYTPNGRRTGNGYEIQLTSKQTYDNGEGDTLWPANLAQSAPIERDHWYQFVLHVVWADHPCRACDDVDDGGRIELWVDGKNVWPGSGQPPAAAARTTLYRWPSAPACDEDKDVQPSHPAGSPMAVYLKLGLYRDKELTNTATVLHKGLRIANRCDAVWKSSGSACPR